MSERHRLVKILHVLGSMNPGGVETWLMHVLRHIDRSRFELHFCTFGPEPGVYALQVEELGGRMIPCPLRQNVWSHPRRFCSILRAGRYDVVHSHVHLFSGAVLRWAHAEGVPMRIAHSHTTNDGRGNTPLRAMYRRLMKGWIGRYATHRLAASKAAEAATFGNGNGHREVLYYGIDPDAFQRQINPTSMRQSLGIPEAAVVVGHVGRFVAAKNHRFLLQVAREIAAWRPDIHFLFVGDGPLREEIEAQATALGFSKRLHFTGSRQDVARLLCGAMDIFVFPSLWEGLGLCVVEAQAAGLRCVASDVVPRDAAVVPEAIDYLPLSLGAGGWAEHILAKLKETRLEPGAALRTVAASSFSINHSVTALSELYESLTAKHDVDRVSG